MSRPDSMTSAKTQPGGPGAGARYLFRKLVAVPIFALVFAGVCAALTAHSAFAAPATVFDDTITNATGFENSRVTFRNPRGTKKYYVFYKDGADSFVKYGYSTDGSAWTNQQAASGEVLPAGANIGFSVDIYDDGTELHVVLIFHENASGDEILRYRHGSITDAASVITWDTAADIGSFVLAERPSVVIDQGGYVWVAANTGDEPGLFLLNVATTPPPASPGTPAEWLSGLGVTHLPTITPIASREVHVVYQEGTSILRGARFTSDGSTITEASTASMTGLTMTSGLISAVNSGGTSHVLYDDASVLKHVTFSGTAFGTPNTVQSTAVTSLSSSVDETSTPDELFAFYTVSASNGKVFFESSPVDTINWGGTQFDITDSTNEALDAVAAGRKDWNGDKIIQVAYTTQTTHLVRFDEVQGIVVTLGDGTDPGSAPLAPGAAATTTDAFTLQITSDTDTVTAATITLSANTFNGISLVEITSDDGVTVYGSLAPTGDTVNLSAMSIPVSTSTIPFKIDITPKTHAAMPAPPGASYAVTATITAFTSTNAQQGTDTDSATMTIDNLSPGNVTGASGSAGDTQNTLNYTTPSDTDVHSVVVLRRASAAVGDTPAEGTTYVVGNTIGSSTVACVDITVSPSTADSCTDTGLINGTAYHYKIFVKDSNVNYSDAGVVPTGSPFTPFLATSIGDGTDPGPVTLPPGGAATEVDAFTFVTSVGTDTVTAATATLATNTFNGIALVEITSDNGSTVYGSVTDPSIDALNMSLSPSISVTTTPTPYKIRVTPKTHANMPAVPGASYAVTATITAFTATTNTPAGTDTDSATVTIDNLSPDNVTGASASPANLQNTVSWTNPGGDFSNVVVLTGTATLTGVPTEDSTPALNDPIGNGTVIYNSTSTSFTDTGLTNGVPYYYRIFAKDSRGNYAQNGVEVTGTPADAGVFQTNARLENDDGGAGYGGSEIAMPYTIKKGERINVRLQVENTDADATNVYRLEYDKDGLNAWTQVLPGNDIRPALSERGRDGERVPVRAAGACGGGVTFVEGEFYEGRSMTDALALALDECTEVVLTVDTANAAVGVAYRLRLFNVTGNVALDGYAAYAEFTAAAARTELHSKAKQNAKPSVKDELRYILDSSGYTNVSADDLLAEIQNNVLRDTVVDVSAHNPEPTLLDDRFGISISSGDVNADGFPDVLVGCQYCDGGGTGSGSVFVFFGGSSMDTTVDVSLHNLEPNDGDRFGFSVSSSDVNGDGFDDVLVGCQYCDGGGTDSGSVYVYFGGSSMDTTVDVSLHNPEASSNDFFGYFVSSSDVNADGFDDVLVGCYQCDGSGTTDSGSAYVYFGGASMDTTVDVSLHNPEPNSSDFFGRSVSSGDVNADGFDDVIVGCDQCDGSGTATSGSAYIYFGGSSMDATVDVSLHNPEPTSGDDFGWSVSSGDVNGDGFPDVIVGCYNCDGSGITDSGSVFAYFGGPSMDTTVDVSLHNPEATGGDSFGISVSSGDVNADGFPDVIVSCYWCDGGGTTDAGSFFVYSMGELMDATEDKGTHNPEPDAGDSVGRSVSSGDVNGDGFPDVIVGCPFCDGSGTLHSGSAYVYFGGPSMDTIADVSLHDPEPPPVVANDNFGISVSSGDVNADGFDDVIVGCESCDGGGTDSGSAFVYFGGTAMDTTVDVSLHDPEPDSGDDFGNSVASGDVNADGYDDVIVGCRICDGSGTTNSGSTYIYFGGSSMDTTVDVSLHNPEPALEGLFDSFGISVSSGDVNADGFDDVLVGCIDCDGSGTPNTGSAFVYFGGSPMNTIVDVSLHNPEAAAGDSFGISVSSGDVNADGSDDVLVGCPFCDGSGTANSGSTYVYFGGTSMDTTADVSLHNPEATGGDDFGESVSSADVNADGFADVIVSCMDCDGGGANSGSVFVYFSGSSMDTTVDVSLHNPEPTSGDEFGRSVSLNDVNADGFADVIVGCRYCDGGGTDSGSVYTYMGGKSADYNLFHFTSKHSNNADDITMTWKGQSTVGAASATMLLEVYRFGATNAWELVDSTAVLGADTEGTLTGTRTGATIAEYYETTTNIVYQRAYQNTTNQLFQTQYFHATLGVETTLGDGTDPGAATVAPGSGITDLDAFTVIASAGTDSITALTVTLGAGSAASGLIGEVRVTSDNGAITYFAAISTPGTDTLNFSAGTPIPVTTSSVPFKVRVTPKTHAAMAAPDGSSFGVTGTVTAFTSTNAQAGSDSGSATITIDNDSPANVTVASATAGIEQVDLAWIDPVDTDLNSIVVLRRATTAVGDVPVEGTTYIVGNTIGSSTVACVEATASLACSDTSLTGGTAYHYKIFAEDSRGNYSATGVVPTGSPATPTAITTTLGDGTDPSSATVAPDSGITDLDAMTFIANTGSDSITALTVSLGAGAAASGLIGEVRVTSDNGAITYFAAISNPGSDTLAFSAGTPIPVTTSSVPFKVRVTPKTHAAMAAPDGSSFGVTGTVTAFTSTNTQAGSDSGSATITIDNDSPANVAPANASAGDGQVDLTWTDPGDGDLDSIIVLRRASTAVGDVPVEGTTYIVTNTIGSSTVVCVEATPDGACSDTGLANGTPYHYKIFAKDSRGNYAATGVVPIGSPATPATSATPINIQGGVQFRGGLHIGQ